MDPLALFSQARDASGFVYVVLAYLLPVLLYCAWSALVFLDLAWSGADRVTVWRWSLATCCVPLIGAAAFLLVGPSRLVWSVRAAIVLGGTALVAVGYLLIYFVFR